MNEIPIIIHTAKGEEVDIIPGLDVGADDYVTKSFSPKVLVASIMAVLRTKAGNSAHWKKEKYTVIVKDNLMIAPVRYEAKVEGIAVDLPATDSTFSSFWHAKQAGCIPGSSLSIRSKGCISGNASVRGCSHFLPVQ